MSYWNDRKALVTGGSGFIGSHLVNSLLDQGASVRVAGRSRERLVRMIGDRIDDVEFLKGDLRDPDFSRQISIGRDSVLHLAARVAGAGWNTDHPGSMLTENLMLALQTIDGAARNDVERFLCVSSACVYERHCTVPTPEDEGFNGDPDPSNFGYGWSKRALEVQAQGYAREFPMKIGIARPYNGYGPRDDFEWETSHVVPALIRKVAEGHDPLQVWGDGTQTRSFLYVSDFVKGLMLVLEKYPECDPVNIGTDEEVTIGHLIETIIRLSERKVSIQFDTSKPKGQPRRNGDFAKAKCLLNFKPEIDLEEGLKRTIGWYNDHAAGIR